MLQIFKRRQSTPVSNCQENVCWHILFVPKRIDLYACECVSVCVGRAYVRTFCARQSQTWSRRLSDRRWRHVDWLTFAAFANAQPPTTGNMPLLPPSSSLKLCRSQCAVCVCVCARVCVWQPLPQPPLTCQAVSQALLLPPLLLLLLLLLALPLLLLFLFLLLVDSNLLWLLRHTTMAIAMALTMAMAAASQNPSHSVGKFCTSCAHTGRRQRQGGGNSSSSSNGRRQVKTKSRSTSHGYAYR